MQATASGCQALRNGSTLPHCKKLYSYVFDEFLPAHRVGTVVLAGHWPAQALSPLKHTIRYLRRYADRVVVLGPPAEYDQSFPRLLARSIMEHDPTLPEHHRIDGPRPLDRRF